jgi:hypothetical protein
MKYLFLIHFLVFLSSDNDWELKKEKSGVFVYTRSVAGSSFDEFKGVTTINNTSLEKVLTVILDVKNYSSLFPDCKNPKVLKQDGKFYDIHIVEVETPWPVKPRDAIYEQKATLSNDKRNAHISLLPLPDYIPDQKEFIRIQKGTGFWDLEEIASGSVKVTYQFHGDPGGEIPSWLANTFVVTQPYQTLINLKNRLAK